VLKKAAVALALIVSVAGVSNSRPAAQFQQRSEQSQTERDMEQRRQKEANKKRQEEIRQDTEKLYQLASELKDAVDKTNEHVLSLDVVKKAEEVEKLAKQVKEKMKEGIGKPLTPEPPPVPPRPPFGPG
jgi:nitric oxide reductase activation protein